MPVKTTRMDEAEFSRIAEKCRKWSERNLGVVRALLVEGDSMTDAAAKHEMSKQQANVLRTRFLAKAGQERIEAFMAREKPKLSTTVLEPFKQDMQTLRDRGYTLAQIVAFLRESDVQTSVTTVRNFLKDDRA